TMAGEVLILSTLIALGVALEVQHCPTPFTRVGSKCYYVSLERANWHVADRRCRKLGSDLALFDDDQDKRLATEYLKSLGLQFTDSWRHSVWVGINCLGNRRTFLLSKTGESVPYLNWVPREPNNASPEEDCVAFANYNSAFGYHDIECKVEFPYICEIPGQSIPEDYLCLKRDIFLAVRL
ncbi:hypothetical protein KR009_001791, partial [Drosophila setifemur]